MNFIYETLIVIAVAIGLNAFASLLCFCDRHFYIKTSGIERKCYVLKKSRFLFLFALAVNWNWKNGIIYKSSFWGTIGFYIYFLCFYIADTIYFILTKNCMVVAAPIYWVAFLVILPLIAIFIYSLTKSLVLYFKNR